jgi:hypothetical protein
MVRLIDQEENIKTAIRTWKLIECRVSKIGGHEWFEVVFSKKPFISIYYHEFKKLSGFTTIENVDYSVYEEMSINDDTKRACIASLMNYPDLFYPRRKGYPNAFKEFE